MLAAISGAPGPASVVTLNSGHPIPVIGLGVYLSAPGSEAYDACLSALKIGYRHIDTAQDYGNEADVGRAVNDSGIPREQLFVTSKIFPPSGPWSYESTFESVQKSLSVSGLQYLDLMLLHAPGPAEGRAEAWRALEDASKQGLVRSIGVSNFGVPHIKKLLEGSSIPPAVNQIELHPFLQWTEETAWCQEQGILVEAYSPLAKAQKLQDPAVTAIAERLQKSPAQVLLRWSLQHGFVPLPKSVNPDRQSANLEVFDWSLSDADVATLDGLEADLVTGWDPIREHAV